MYIRLRSSPSLVLEEATKQKRSTCYWGSRNGKSEEVSSFPYKKTAENMAFFTAGQVDQLFTTAKALMSLLQTLSTM